MQTVCLATPSLTFSVSLEHKRSLIGTLMLLLHKGQPPSLLDNGGNQFVEVARCQLAWQFMAESTADCLFFLDDDVGWDPQKVIDFLERPEPIIAGVYPKREDPEAWPVVLAAHPETKELVRSEDGKLIRALMAPTGFMKIHRSVFEAMLALPNIPWFDFPDRQGVMHTLPTLFNRGRGPDGSFWPEDKFFCEIATELGFDVWIDPEIDFTHRGTKLWACNMIDAMPEFERRAKEAENGLPGLSGDDDAPALQAGEDHPAG